jgi:hypothetical protein
LPIQPATNQTAPLQQSSQQKTINMGYCTNYFGTFFILMDVLLVIMLASTVPILRQYILQKKEIKKEDNLDNKAKQIFMWNLGLIFFIFNIFTLLMCFSLTMQISIKCDSAGSNSVINAFWMFGYNAQTYFLLLIAFTRLKVVFDSTQFALKKCAINIYRIIFTMVPFILLLQTIVLILVKVAGAIKLYTIMSLLITLEMLIMTVTMIATIILFIRKLMVVYKTIAADNALISTITKLTILNATSLSISVLAPLIMIFIMSADPGETIATTAFMVSNIFDVFTNFWCIVLSTSSFQVYYDKICGSIHIKCRTLWFKCLGTDEKMLTDAVKHAAKPQKMITLSTQASSSAGSATSEQNRSKSDDVVQVDITSTA